MKNQTTKILLFLVLCGLGFAPVGLRSLANPAECEISTRKPTQLGYGRAPHPPQSEISTRPTQLGYGRAPHPPQSEISTRPTQLGYGHAPHPPQSEISTRPTQLGCGQAPQKPLSKKS